MDSGDFIICLDERDETIRRQQKDLKMLRLLAYGDSKFPLVKKWYRLWVRIMEHWPVRNILSKTSYLNYRAGLADQSLRCWWWKLVYNLVWGITEIRNVEKW